MSFNFSFPNVQRDVKWLKDIQFKKLNHQKTPQFTHGLLVTGCPACRGTAFCCKISTPEDVTRIVQIMQSAGVNLSEARYRGFLCI